MTRRIRRSIRVSGSCCTSASKVAAKKDDRYYAALKKHEAIIAKNVTENLFERHMKPLLLGK